MYQHMAVRVEADGISCHTFSRYNVAPFRDTWELAHEHYLYTFIHFPADDPAPSGNMIVANGWWVASAYDGDYFYYLLADDHIRWTDNKPVTLNPPPLDLNRAGYWFDIGGKLLIIWRTTGSVEKYDFPFVASSYSGVWYYGATETPISIDRLV